MQNVFWQKMPRMYPDVAERLSTKKRERADAAALTPHTWDALAPLPSHVQHQWPEGMVPVL